MKFKPFWLLVIAVLTIAVILVCDRAIVPKNVAGQVRPLKIKPLKMITATGDCLIYHVPVLYQDIPSPKPEKPEWLKRFTGDYREYSAECYADSNYVWCDSVQVYGMSETSWRFSSKVTWREWKHRKSTLPGFMEFLEKKYK